ncbi:5972_t:CDS:10 [Funneliformis caledonium]|uniref:5972_t:CDS:1 n=1 Tax=Funneliformis caledonium TaxID=1117310 RepID=A0A9N8WGD6_9GLOM|nr:5972_t:CDS:10 [Funneliformis caledonium]
MDGYQTVSDDSRAEQISQNKHAMKSKLEQIFVDFDKDNCGRIATRDLLSMIELFERNQSESLLNDENRPTFQNFCEQNPDMEVSVDDVIQLIDKLRPSVPSNNNNKVTSGPITKTKFRSFRSNLRNRPNAPREAMLQEPDGDDHFNPRNISASPSRSRRLSASGFYESPAMISSSFASPYDTPEETIESFEGNGGIDEAVSNLITSNNNDDPAVQLSRLYRHTVDLTKRLKESERHLASVARQHEDRIEELQHKLDETKADLAAKKREIQEHKGKEKTNLHQISSLEGEISKLAKNLTSQKQLYLHFKTKYEEQCAESLKGLVREKEDELNNNQRTLSQFHDQKQTWIDDRERLEDKLSKLEIAAQRLEAELSNENLHLKETIDKLKLELEEMERSSRVLTEFEAISEIDNINNNKNNLATEIINHALASIEEGGSDSNTDDVRDRQLIKTQRRRKDDTSDINASEEQSHSRSGELDRYRGTDIDHTSRKQSGSRSRRQVTDVNGITRNTSGRDIESQYQILSSELGVQYALIEGILRNRDMPGPHDKRDRDRQIRNSVDGDSTDLVRHSKLTRQPTKRSKRRAPVPEIEPQSSEKIEQAMQSSKALVTRNQNMTVQQNNVVVNSTVTFELYTLVIYLFGIITSVFVLDNNQGALTYSDWLPHDVVDESWTMRSFQIILYWIETLLNDGNMRVPT